MGFWTRDVDQIEKDIVSRIEKVELDISNANNIIEVRTVELNRLRQLASAKKADK